MCLFLEIVSSGPVFSSFFLAIFGNFEARGKSFEFSHEDGQKEIAKKIGCNWKKPVLFLCVFFAQFHGRTQRIFPWLQNCQK